VEIVVEQFGLTLQSLPLLRYEDVYCVRSGALCSLPNFAVVVNMKSLDGRRMNFGATTPASDQALPYHSQFPSIDHAMYWSFDVRARTVWTLEGILYRDSHAVL